MDSENVGRETIVKVTGWLRGIWEMRRRTGPVQQWVDSIPSPTKISTTKLSIEPVEYQTSDTSSIPGTPTEPKDIPFSNRSYIKPPTMTVSAPINVPSSPGISAIRMPCSLPHNRLPRNPSVQSDSSHCSSVESLLELRRADPEAILLGLGFGGCSNSPQENGPLSRIPKRFLQPSKLKGITINDFVRQQQETSESFDSVSLGYRGLTGSGGTLSVPVHKPHRRHSGPSSPYVAPSEIVQKIMERLREHESHEMDTYNAYNYCEPYSPFQQNGRLSVLSPDNRQFLEQPRSRSPDMRNKRMIIGQKSFAFGCDGDLIEIASSETKVSLHDDYGHTEESVKRPDNDAANPGSNKTSDRVLKKVEKRLPKQLSFDESIDFSETEQESNEFSAIFPNDQEIFDNQKHDSVTEKNKGTCTRKLCNCFDHRRASDGCDIGFKGEKVTPDGERRFSDGATHVTLNESKCSMPHRRKSLKRQSRISEMDALRYCMSSTPRDEEDEENEPTSSCDRNSDADDSENNSYNLKVVKAIPNSVGDSAQSKDGISTSGSDSHDFLNGAFNELPSSSTALEEGCKGNSLQLKTAQTRVNCHHEKNQACCQNKVSERVCAHEKNCKDCCCHRMDGTKCCKKMEKIMRDNKKLETMVAKNRREMAEIRDMLSSVLSVRLEPGF